MSAKKSLVKCSGISSAIEAIDKPDVFVVTGTSGLAYSAILLSMLFLMSSLSTTASITQSHSARTDMSSSKFPGMILASMLFDVRGDGFSFFKVFNSN